MLPSLLTLCNLLCGFAAIHFVTRGDLTLLLPVACYLIFAAMICDALDGSLARLSRSTSDFGGQLDSLADVISFGAAPAFISIRLMRNVLASHASAEDWLVGPAADTLFGRICWLTAAVYVACAALRLARFNVENVQDTSAHMGFRGLPVPGAAGAVISLALLIHSLDPALRSYETLIKTTPLVLMALALLMVSRLPYVHIANRYLRGRKPFWMLVAVILGLMAFIARPRLVLAIALCGYAFSGPVTWAYAGLFAKAATSPSPDDSDTADQQSDIED